MAHTISGLRQSPKRNDDTELKLARPILPAKGCDAPQLSSVSMCYRVAHAVHLPLTMLAPQALQL